MPLMLQLMEPAAPTVVRLSTGITVSLPSTTMCGDATSAAILDAVVVGRAVAHLQRAQDALLGEFFPGLARHRGDHLARHHVEQVVVIELGAEARYRLQVAQAVHDLGTRHVGGRKEHQVAGAQAQAAAVRQQVANGEFARDVRVVHAELRQDVDDLVVPAHLAFVHEHGEGRRREGLGVGADLEQGVGAHLLGLPLLAHAIALGVDQLAVLDDADGHARHLEGLHGARDGAIDLRRRNRQRCGLDRERECGHEASAGERGCEKADVRRHCGSPGRAGVDYRVRQAP